jgi:hypothetical protein
MRRRFVSGVLASNLGTSILRPRHRDRLCPARLAVDQQQRQRHPCRGARSGRQVPQQNRAAGLRDLPLKKA